MGARISVMTADCTCTNQLNGKGTAGGSQITISAAVGKASPPRCRNLPADVKTIQAALNRFSPQEGGPSVSLAVDGICGPKTKEAIFNFQKKWDLIPKFQKVPDGIVDPVGRTIDRLRAGPGAISDLPGEFAERLPKVMQVITAARAAITSAKFHLRNKTVNAQIPSLSLLGKAAADKAERHFHLSKTANPINRLSQLENMFLNMQTAIGFVPQGVVVARAEPPGVAVGSFMFTFEGGYSLRGQDDSFEGIPVSSIYLCPKARTLNADGFTYAMIHELAHYTGPTSSGVIDIAYFHKQPLQYKNLSADNAFHNADSYSQFAYDVINRPDFNIEQNRTS
jgi:hypothetical protein